MFGVVWCSTTHHNQQMSTNLQNHRMSESVFPESKQARMENEPQQSVQMRRRSSIDPMTEYGEDYTKPNYEMTSPYGSQPPYAQMQHRQYESGRQFDPYGGVPNMWPPSYGLESRIFSLFPRRNFFAGPQTYHPFGPFTNNYNNPNIYGGFQQGGMPGMGFGGGGYGPFGRLTQGSSLLSNIQNYKDRMNNMNAAGTEQNM